MATNGLCTPMALARLHFFGVFMVHQDRANLLFLFLFMIFIAKIIFICFVKFKYHRRGAKKTSTICLSYDLHSNHSCRISFASDISTDLSVFLFLQDVQQLHPTLIKLLYFRRDAKLLPTKASQTASPPRSAHIQPDL